MKTEDHMILPDLDEGVMTGNNSVLPNKQEAPSVWLAPENFEELGFFLAMETILTHLSYIQDNPTT